MNSILDVTQSVEIQEGIVGKELHTYQPQTQGFNNNDEIRISINQQDIFTLPHESVLHIQGQLMKSDGTTPTTSKLANNALAFLFSEVRYLVNNVEVDSTRNVGITSTMKLYPSYGSEENKAYLSAGWCPLNSTNDWMINTDGTFTAELPLKLILGFAEDHKRILVNAKQELILVRDRSDNNALKAPTTAGEAVVPSKIQLHRILWKMPHVTLSDKMKLEVLKLVESDRPLLIEFRGWEVYEFPLLPTTDKHSWSIKTSRYTERPLYVIVGFQTDRKYQQDKDASQFDHINLRNIRLFLNGVVYPYEGLDLNFEKNNFNNLHTFFTNFQKSYYQKSPSPLLSPQEFKEKAPLVVMDSSYLEESIKEAPVDIRLEFETSANVPAKTTAYCLIIHEARVFYHPLSNMVTRV